MRLITQNLLTCNKRTCQAPGIVNFPLKLTVANWNDFEDDSTMPCTKPLMTKLSEKLEWGALRETVNSVSPLLTPSLFLRPNFWRVLYSSTGVSLFQRLLRNRCLRMSRWWLTCIYFCLNARSLKDLSLARTANAFTKSREAFQTCSLMKMRCDWHTIFWKLN